MHRVGGRIFSDDVIKRLSETIQKEPCLSRRKLSRLVCEWMDWRNQAGRLQEMSCRKALLELDRRKEINLPKVNKHYAFQKVNKPAEAPPIAEVSCELAELGGRRDYECLEVWNT